MVCIHLPNNGTTNLQKYCKNLASKLAELNLTSGYELLQMADVMNMWQSTLTTWCLQWITLEPLRSYYTMTTTSKLRVLGRSTTTLYGFFRDKDNVLCIKTETYIEKMMDSYQRMFGVPPRIWVYSPLKANNYPKLDDSKLFDAEGIQQY